MLLFLTPYRQIKKRVNRGLYRFFDLPLVLFLSTALHLDIRTYYSYYEQRMLLILASYTLLYTETV